MVSHNLEQMRRIADRVTVLDRGVVADGPPDAVLIAPHVIDLLPSRPARTGVR
jgi:ABC-type branched-subunit amino acid transport system ATPase component